MRDSNYFYADTFSLFLQTPNGWRVSRLADLAGCAGLGSSIHRIAEEHTDEDPSAKAKSAPTAGWAFLILIISYRLS